MRIKKTKEKFIHRLTATFILRLKTSLKFIYELKIQYIFLFWLRLFGPQRIRFVPYATY